MHEQRTNNINYLGETNYRNGRIMFGIKDHDRFSHIYCCGKSGSGKSTLLQRMAVSDIQNGKGLACLDPHGDVAKFLIDYLHVQYKRAKDLIIFDPLDPEYPSHFNPLANVPPEQRSKLAAELVQAFRHVWPDSFGPRMSYVWTYCILTLFTYPGATLLHIKPLLTDTAFRAQVLMYVSDPDILKFWEKEFNAQTPSFRNEVISPILNKIGILHTSQALKNAFGHEQSDFDMQEVMDTNKILIVNIPKGAMGEEASSLLGSILSTVMMQTALARSNQDETDRVPFYLYIDECQSFVNPSFAKMLSECRKFKLGVLLANQYLSQLDEQTQNAIFGNAGTLIVFQVGSTDAPRLSQEFYPVFSAENLINLTQFSFYIRLMIDGQQSKPFSAQSIKVI